ncbi:hypothetical protein, partial [Listeria innocua]|uniref:hypothetical protein n=1 Tax=Listeria innocua TaxID=1642 RepID=UPI001C88EB47
MAFIDAAKPFAATPALIIEAFIVVNVVDVKIAFIALARKLAFNKTIATLVMPIVTAIGVITFTTFIKTITVSKAASAKVVKLLI